jgi:hypothetical protein
MPQLGEVLGGILTDVVRARMAADIVTVQAYETYRSDPALASLSVPRVTVSTLTVKLSFAVNAVQPPPAAKVDLERAKSVWTSRLEARVASELPPPRKPPASGPLPIREVPVRVTHLDRGLDGDVEPLVDATMSHLMEGRGRVSKVARDELTAQVRDQALAFVDSLRQQRFTDAAIRSTLDVDVVAESVAQTAPEALQTLEVTFAVDDLEEVLTVPDEWR